MEEDLRLAGYVLEFLRFCYFCETRGTREMNLRGRWSKQQIVVWRNALMAMGLASWKFPTEINDSYKARGWHLTATMDEILATVQKQAEGKFTITMSGKE